MRSAFDYVLPSLNFDLMNVVSVLPVNLLSSGSSVPYNNTKLILLELSRESVVSVILNILSA